MYRARETTTSIVGPIEPPINCNSSAMKSDTVWTFLRCFHRRLMTSHCCGVVMMIRPFSILFKSVVVSPASLTTETPKSPNRAFQSSYRSSASVAVGAMYTHRPGFSADNARMMANSAHTVFPLPVGAPTSALSSVLYKH